MSRDDALRWDERYRDDSHHTADHPPFGWLVAHTPSGRGGLALDLACGPGHNAVWLASRGWRVIGVDVSQVALRRGRDAARQLGLNARALFVRADLDTFRPAPGAFDLVAVIRYLNRDLFPALAAALRPGGTLIAATFNLEWLKSYPDSNPDYLLRPGELAGAFPWLEVVDMLDDGPLSCVAARKPSEEL